MNQCKIKDKHVDEICEVVNGKQRKRSMVTMIAV